MLRRTIAAEKAGIRSHFWKTLMTLGAICMIGVVAPGCDSKTENAAEDAVDAVGDAAHDAKDAVEDAAKDAGDAVKDATN